MILLDSNVISELMNPKPAIHVVQWLNQQPRSSIWTTSINVFEIRVGLQLMPMGKRRTALNGFFEHWLNESIQQRIAVFDTDAALRTADLAASRQRIGRPGELRDTMIAGIVLSTHATLATRNVKHFAEIASSVVNPWQA